MSTVRGKILINRDRMPVKQMSKKTRPSRNVAACMGGSGGHVIACTGAA